jgi:hypothetical protein
VGLARPDGSVTRPHRSGLVVDAADGPLPPLVASLLPLAVWAGALAFAGLAGVGEGDPPPLRARTTRTREVGRRVRPLPTAMRHDTGLCPNLGRRVALKRGRGDAQGEGIREAPRLGIALEGSYLRPPRMAGRSACWAHLRQAGCAALDLWKGLSRCMDRGSEQVAARRAQTPARQAHTTERLHGRQPRVRMNWARARRSCQARPESSPRRSPRRRHARRDRGASGTFTRSRSRRTS